MKKTIFILLAVGILAAGSVSASAGGYRTYGGHGAYYSNGGNSAGAFFVGLLGGAILGTVIANSTRPAVVYAPPPAYVPPPPAQVWVPPHYETRYERQWVPGYWAEEPLGSGGAGYRGSRRVWYPARYETIPSQVWVPGHWEARG
jgi:hypothetical protein